MTNNFHLNLKYPNASDGLRFMSEIKLQLPTMDI